MNIVILIGIILLVLIIVVIILCVAYSVSAAYQQTFTIKVPFEETYRYVPILDEERKFKLENIKVTVAGSIRKKTSAFIVPGDEIATVIKDQIIEPHKSSLLMHETLIFTVQEDVLKRCPLAKHATMENLSIVFFNKLAPLMPDIGCQLVSVQLESEGLKVTHARYKMNTYSV
jgi:hypothetical protein